MFTIPSIILSSTCKYPCCIVMSFSFIEKLKYSSNSFIFFISALPPNLVSKKGNLSVVNTYELPKTLVMASSFFHLSNMQNIRKIQEACSLIYNF